MDIITMSLGTNTDYQELRDVCNAAYNAGIVLVAAAGNAGSSVSYPAAYDSVIAVSATASDDTIPSWSNYGPEIELAAPGVDIYSTWKGGEYKTASGTSMATPHVSGTVALVPTSEPGIYDLDNDTLWDPEEVRSKLHATAEDLGNEGFDYYYGYGLVDAKLASN
jgi:subtilisin family serine protease